MQVVDDSGISPNRVAQVSVDDRPRLGAYSPHGLLPGVRQLRIGLCRGVCSGEA